MKTLNSKLIYLVATVSLMGVGCGKSFEASSSTYQPPIINDPGIIPVSPDGNGSQGGGTPSLPSGSKTVDFTPVSFAEFNSYVGMRPLNNPSNYKLTVDLQNAGNGRYAGNVKISYIDNNYTYSGSFDAGFGTNVSIKGLKDNDMMESEFNRWFIINGKYYFSAYFQDAYGAIVVVFDTYTTSGAGDAQGGEGVVSGAVYYKNFAQSYAQQSPYRKCWFIREGPYNCRADAVINKNSVYPGNGFKKLGTFKGLSKSAALNE